MSAGRLRVEWSPGSDTLTGICHCGARRTAQDPAEIWAWLLSHPGHPAPAALEGGVSLG